METSKDRVTEAPRAGFFSEGAFRLWVIGVVGVSLAFALQDLYPSLIGPLSNVLPAGGAGVAFASALLCWRRYGFGLRRQFEAVWFMFSLGSGLWILAELAWATYYFFLNVEVPYPSIADIFYIGGYFPMLAGLVLYLRAFSVAMSRKRLSLALSAIGVAVTLAMAFVLPLELTEGLSPLNLLTDLAYPILDLALISLTVLALAIFIGGAISKWWVLFGGASVLYVIGDEYFLYQFAAGTYYNGSFDDLLFVLGYLALALAFYAHRREF